MASFSNFYFFYFGGIAFDLHFMLSYDVIKSEALFMLRKEALDWLLEPGVTGLINLFWSVFLSR